MTGLSRYQNALQKRILSAMTAYTGRAQAFARQIVPYGDGSDGGHLRDCIFSRVYELPGLVVGEVYAQNPHAMFVELGTYRMAAQPYLRPALRKHKNAFLHALKK